MPAPIVLGAARVATMVASNPTVRAKVAEYYSKATGKVIDFASAKAVQDVVAKGPAPAAVVLRGAVRAGVNPDAIFEGIILNEQRDAASARIINELRALYKDVGGKLDATSVIHTTGSLAANLLNKEIYQFARRAYGSPNAIREAHAKLRAFLAMDTQVLEETIALHN